GGVPLNMDEGVLLYKSCYRDVPLSAVPLELLGFSGDEAFKEFKSRVVELLSHVLMPMYVKVFAQYWHTSELDVMPKPYVFQDFEGGVVALAVPVAYRCSMEYHEVVFKVVPEAGGGDVEGELEGLKGSLTKPNGVVTGRTVYLIARRRRKDVKGLVAARFKPSSHEAVIPVICSGPEAAVKRALAMLAGFLSTRLEALTARLTEWEPVKNRAYKLLKTGWRNVYYYIYKYNSILLGLTRRVVKELAASLNSMWGAVKWLLEKVREIGRELKRKYIVMFRLRDYIEGLKGMLEVFKPSVFTDTGKPSPPLIGELLKLLGV
ncbi:MAG: hypothetical protein QW734_11295, partial [Candidatus Bathyarchaeia archaeon]